MGQFWMLIGMLNPYRRKSCGMGVYPLQYLSRGNGLCNIPSPKLTIFWLIFTKIQCKSIDFALKICWFLMILGLHVFYKKILQKCKIWVSQAQWTSFLYSLSALNCTWRFSPNRMIPVSKIQNFPASEGGTFPLRHPLMGAQAHNWRWRTTKSSPNVEDDSIMPLFTSCTMSMMMY